MNTNENHQPVVPANHAPPPAALPVPVSNGAPPAAGGERVGDVMNRHLQLMQHFLDVQKTVVLAYLGQRAAEPAAYPPTNGHVELPPPAVLPPPAFEAPPVLPVALPETAPVAAAPAPLPAVAPQPEPSTNGHAGLGADEIADRLLEIVSERTGYPRDMLELDADLEADLGIDSIKRVEIVGTMIQSLSLADGVTPDVEEITSSRTLRQAIAALESLRGPNGSAPKSAVLEGETLPFEPTRADEQGSARDGIGRYVVRATTAPPAALTAGLAAEGVVVLVDDGTGVGDELAARLSARGHRVARIGADAAFDDPATVESLGAPAKALVHLAALGDDRGGGDGGLTGLFLLARALAPGLERSAESGGAAVLAATAMGGGFGLGGSAVPQQGALAGFLKSLAYELPGVRVKAVDVEPGDPDEVAAALLAELDAADGVVEVGYRDGGRTHVEVVPAPLDGRGAEPAVDGDSVVLVTGGARGITAEAAVALARVAPATFVLVGRTPPGEDEDPATASLTEPRDLRQALLDRLRAERDRVTPAEVERSYRELMGAREVRANLERLRAAGARVEYRAFDVRDAAAFAELVDDLYETYGRIDGVIHGAGVIEDKLVRDKELDSFERVLATKARSARALAEALRPDSLRFLVFFGSVSGRFGNRGQADYAAASEVLNKLAHELDRRWPARVVSIDWGPWLTTGMVSPALQEEFERRGVRLIPIDVGCEMLVEELERGRKGEAEVVIGGMTSLAGEPANVAASTGETPEADEQPLLTVNTAVARKASGVLEAVRTFELADDLYLNDHRIDGRPIVPFAVSMELLAETAAAAYPALEFAGLRDVRVLGGITVDEAGYGVRVTATPLPEPGPTGLTLETTMVSRDGPRAHYRALVDLRPAGSAVELPQSAPLGDLAPFPTTVADAYRDLLFHGPLFQRIASIEGMDERGASAVVLPSTPAGCLRGSPGGRWLLDPVMIDCAFQLQVVWARLQWGVTLLPGSIDSVVRSVVDTSQATEGVRLELRIRPGSKPPLCHADHFFYAPDGRLLAVLTNAQGVGSKALNRLAGVGS